MNLHNSLSQHARQAVPILARMCLTTYGEEEQMPQRDEKFHQVLTVLEHIRDGSGVIN